MNGLRLENEICDSFHNSVGPQYLNNNNEWHDSGVYVMLAVFPVLGDLEKVYVEVPNDYWDDWKDDWDEDHVTVFPEPVFGYFEDGYDVSESFLFGQDDEDDDEKSGQ